METTIEALVRVASSWSTLRASLELGLGGEHEGAAVSRDGVELAVGGGDGGVDQPRFGLELLFEGHFARLRVEAVGHAARFVEPVKVSVDVNRGGDVRSLADGPEDVGVGDVAASSGANRDGRVLPSADGVDDVAVCNHAGADVSVGDAVAVPEFFAGRGIEARQLVGSFFSRGNGGIAQNKADAEGKRVKENAKQE